MAQEANSGDPSSILGTTHFLTSLNLPVSSLAPDSNWIPVTKTTNEGQFRLNVTISILDVRAQKECSCRGVHVLLQISWLAGALRVIIAALATSRASTQTTFVKFVAAFSSLLLVWFAGEMKSECPSRDDEQHCRCVVWEEKTVLQSLDVAFSASNRKSSFLRVLHCCEGGRRLALLQEDSRVGRARIRKILALAE